MHLTSGLAGWKDVAISETGCSGEKEREIWTDMEGRWVRDAKHTVFTFTVCQAAVLWRGLMRATVQMHRQTWANWKWLKSVSACSATLVQLLPLALVLPYCLVHSTSRSGVNIDRREGNPWPNSRLRLGMQIDKNELQIEGVIRRQCWPICHPVKAFSPFFCTGTGYKRWSYVLFLPESSPLTPLPPLEEQVHPDASKWL